MVVVSVSETVTGCLVCRFLMTICLPSEEIDVIVPAIVRNAPEYTRVAVIVLPS